MTNARPALQDQSWPDQPEDSGTLFRLRDQKFAPPRADEGLIERPELFEKLLSFREHRFILLSAPAGYGKTCLMAKHRDYLYANGERTAWLALDNLDNDSARLRLDFRAALSCAFGQEKLEESWVIPAADGNPCTVFIDDLHVLTDESTAVLCKLLTETLPRNLRFVIGSRRRNALQISPLKNKGKLAEIDQADFAFSLEETKTFLQRRLGDVANESFVESLYLHTEGWPEALQLACASLRQRGVGNSVALEFLLAELTVIAALLTNEVFESQSAVVQEFLLDMAVVSQFSASLCERIRKSRDSEALIDKLFNAGIPGQQLDAGWHRLHPLFAAHLRSLSRKRNAAQFAANGRVAAAWLVDDGRSFDAVEALLATDSADDAVHLMEKLVHRLLVDAQYGTAIRWCERLPAQTVQSSALICSTYALCLTICNRREQAALWCTRCVEQSKIAGADPLYASTAQLIKMYELVSRGTSEQLATAAPILEDAVVCATHFERGSFANLLAYVQLAAGNYVGAEKSILISKRIFREERRFFGLANTHYLEAIAAAAQGRLREAVSYLETVSLLARENQKRTPPSYLYAMSGGFIAALYYELNDLEQAKSWVGSDRYASELSTSSDSVLCGTLVAFRLALLQGRTPDAFALMETRLAAARAGGFSRVAHALELELARYAALNNQPEKAEAYRGQLLENFESMPAYRYIRPSEETEGAGVAQARLMLHSGLHKEGRVLIDALLADATVRKRKWREAKLRILRAIALDKQGNAIEAAEEITYALELGASMGLVRTFLDEGRAFVDRLHAFAISPHRAELSQPVAAYLTSLLGIADAETRIIASPAAAAFSEQETKVLDLIARGRTNKDVATALALSVNTVKWHLTHIYTKLGVHNRSQAVFTARQRGLMS